MLPPVDESDHLSDEPHETRVFLSPLNLPTQLRGFVPSAPLPSSTGRVFHVLKGQREKNYYILGPAIQKIASQTGVPSTGADFRHLFACAASARKKIFAAKLYVDSSGSGNRTWKQVEILGSTFFPSATMCASRDSHGQLHHFFFESLNLCYQLVSCARLFGSDVNNLAGKPYC